jgi:aspartyl/glutamyl-tRNA(Asn/Gln) amidotransferase C subunit
MGLADAPLDRTQLDRLCRLARLELDEDARQELGRRLRDVVHAFASLALIDTAGVPPHVAGQGDPDRLREDAPGPVLPLAAVQANCRSWAAGCFLVPRVVEG